MLKFSMPLAAIALLCGCKNQTGQDWLDPILVSDYTERAELTYAFRDATSFCAFGCMQICAMTPEPEVHNKLAEENFTAFTGLRERASESGLLLDLPRKPGPIIMPLTPRDLSEDEIGPTKLECIEKHREHIDGIETLLDRLAPKEP